MKTRRTLGASLVALVVATALVAGPIAGAGARTGASDRLVTFGISFDGVYKKGKPVKVKNLVYSNLNLVCDEGNVIYSPSKKFPRMDVNRKLKFHGTLKVDGVTSKVAGKYKRDLSKVTGTVRATGDFGGGTNCNGKIPWQTN